MRVEGKTAIPPIMAKMGDKPKQRPEVTARLQALQQALDASHEEMATYAGVKPTAWGNYYLGERRFKPEEAINLRNRLGVTLDWIFAGIATDNPKGLQAKIDEAMRNPQPLKRGPKPKARHSR